MIKLLNTKVKDMKAITLIALVITIVVLIILAAVAINLSLGNNGIFNRAKTAKEQYSNAQDYEAIETSRITNSIDSITNGSRETVTLTMKSPPMEVAKSSISSGYPTTFNGSYTITSSNLFTNTVSEQGVDYIEFRAGEGYKILKSRFLLFNI